MNRSFSPGKLITFVIATVLGGLLQVWVLWLILLSISGSPSLSELLGNGGLFFFSTSLIATSLIALVDRYSLRRGSAELNITLIAFFGVMVPAVVLYTSVLTSGIGRPSPFSAYLLPQLGCAFAAFAYALYVAARTGQFVMKRSTP